MTTNTWFTRRTRTPLAARAEGISTYRTEPRPQAVLEALASHRVVTAQR